MKSDPAAVAKWVKTLPEASQSEIQEYIEK